MSGLDQDEQEATGGRREKLLSRVYRRQRETPNPNGKSARARGRRDDGRQRDQGRQRDRADKFSEEAAADAEQRIRADQEERLRADVEERRRAEEERRRAEEEERARVEKEARDLMESLGPRIAALRKTITALNDDLEHELARYADPFEERRKAIAAALTALAKEAPPADEMLERAEAIDDDVGLLSGQVALVHAEIKKKQLAENLEWAQKNDSQNRFAGIRQEVMNIRTALFGADQVDFAALAASIVVIEAARAQESGAESALVTLRADWLAAKQHAEPVLSRVANLTGKPAIGPAAAKFAALDSKLADDMHADVLDMVKRNALAADIAALDQWGQAAATAIAGFKYFDLIMSDEATNRNYSVSPSKDSPALPFASNSEAIAELRDAVMTIPFNAGTFKMVCAEVTAFPGFWRSEVNRDDASAAAASAVAQTNAAVGALANRLSAGAPGWGVAPANAAQALARQLYKAYPNALNVLQTTGVTRATWNALNGYIPSPFDDQAAVFEALNRLGSQAEANRLVTQRLPFLALTAANGVAVLGSNDAEFGETKRYDWGGTLGASVVIKWRLWMPGRFATDQYWGAVHFHFPAQDIMDIPDMVHIKDYITHTVGGNGTLITINRSTALARRCLAKVRTG